MNNLAYSTQNIDKVAANAEEILRKDLGVEQPLSYTVSEPDAPKENVLSTFGKALSVAIFGGKEKVLCNLAFDIQSPRPVSILMMINKQGLAGSHAGSIVFTTQLNKKITGGVTMEGPKTFGTSKFIGDAATAAKLNGNKDLLKMTEKFARTKSDVGGGIKMDRYVSLEPKDNGTELTIVTLPRAYSMGIKATTDANDFIAIAGLMEQVL
jgi:hypothetical protein